MVSPKFKIPEKPLWGDVFKAAASDCVVEIIVIPCWYDNYAFVVYDKETKNAVAIDAIEPGEFDKVIKQNGLNLKYILTTHHHMDHAHGNSKMHELYPNVPVVGLEGAATPCMNRIVHDKEDLSLTEQIKIRIYAVPGHTMDHLTFTFYDAVEGGDPSKRVEKKRPAIFTGDFLFTGGCGKFFEGTPTDMYNSIKQTLDRHAANTYMFGGHEYGTVNMLFATDFEPNNQNVKDSLKKYQIQKVPCIPSSFENELLINPFIRAVMNKDAIDNVTAKSVSNGQELLGQIRLLKTKFSETHNLVCVGG